MVLQDYFIMVLQYNGIIILFIMVGIDFIVVLQGLLLVYCSIIGFIVGLLQYYSIVYYVFIVVCGLIFIVVDYYIIGIYYIVWLIYCMVLWFIVVLWYYSL